MTRYYTGIGSEEAPQKACDQAYHAARRLHELGYTLLSGGANGMDIAFQKGCQSVNGKMNIILPYNGFRNNYKSEKDGIYLFKDLPQNIQTECDSVCAQLHPVWNKIGHTASAVYLKRDVCQVRGINLDIKSDFILCYTEDGVEDGTKTTRQTGGTAMAMRIATPEGIPIFNLYHKDALNRLSIHLKELKVIT